MPKNNLKENLEAFIANIPKKNILNKVTLNTEYDIKLTESTLETFVNECYASLELIEQYLVNKNIKILEVGAGTCLFSLFLKSQGYNIIALEPATNGFDIFHSLKNAILSCYEGLDLQVLPIKAEVLGKEHGEFDLIFGNNVIEHIPSYQVALSSMMSCLSSDGIIIHSCPNYSFPYEPHFSIPIFRRFKKISEILFRRRIEKNKELWESLNFITSKEVAKYSKQNNIACEFEKSLLYKAFLRFESDTIFRQRHAKGFISITFKILKLTGLLTLVKFVPTSLQSPMIFKLSKSP